MRGTVHPLFEDKKVKNLLLHAVNRGNLRRLNYNKTVFDLGSAQDLAGRGHDTLPDRMRRNTSSNSPAVPHRTPRAPRSPSELVPHFSDQSYTPECCSLSSGHGVYTITIHNMLPE